MLRIRDVFPGSRILIFYPSRIPDHGSKNLNKTEGRKKICCHTGTFFCSHKFHKNEKNFIFEMLKKKIGPSFKNYRTFYPKNLSLSSKKSGFGIRDPRSGIRNNIPDAGSGSGVKKAPDPRYRIPDPDPQHRKSRRENSPTYALCAVLLSGGSTVLTG
jgi:hypothetical protein